MRNWTDDFANYRHTITERRIERWLSQFDLPDIDLAARILDVVDFVTNEQIAAAYRHGLTAIQGWSVTKQKRQGKWRFAAFSASAGESGDAMLHKLRHANNLAAKAHNELFLHKSELLGAGLGKGDKIVLVDDFSATGTQITQVWPELSEFMPEGPDVHLLLVAASREALSRVSNETELIVHAEIILTPEDALFDDACKHFSDKEKSVVKDYCKRVGSSSAQAFTDKGYTLVFAHSCPNNTLPILHATNADWEGLFRRYDN